ncbi:MAG: pesticidal protein Cry7Aa, partial [Candidatus Altiarchaeota archaeon]|nr:pesticidal protein Cry7Aa [Candidatus Altiarchaeota archaeon]
MVVEVKREGVILESTDKEFERQAVCNPGCIRVGDKVKMFYRAIRENNYSSIGYCELDGPLEV